MLTETDKQLKDMNISKVTHAIASVGVGSWAQAVTMHYKTSTYRSQVVTVEPDTAASLKASLDAGKITPITTGETIMNGMNCGTTSTTAFEVLRNGVDMSVTVSDLHVHKDIQYLKEHGINVGPCGAAPLTALRQLCREQKDTLVLDAHSTVVLFSTEGPREYEIPKPADQ